MRRLHLLLAQLPNQVRPLPVLLKICISFSTLLPPPSFLPTFQHHSLLHHHSLAGSHSLTLFPSLLFISISCIPPYLPPPPPPVVEKIPLISQGQQGVVVLPPPSTQPVFKEFPVDMVDERGNRFTTEVRYTTGLLTWVAVGITCLVAGMCIQVHCYSTTCGL